MKKILKLVQKGFKIHKDNLTKKMAEIKAKEVESIGYKAVIIQKNKLFTVWVGHDNFTKKQLPEFSNALKGHIERKEFIKHNNIPIPKGATTSKQLQVAIEIWFNNNK